MLSLFTLDWHSRWAREPLESYRLMSTKGIAGSISRLKSFAARAVRARSAREEENKDEEKECT